MRLSRRLHRWLAIIAALPLLWLCLTGVLLNHAVDLGLEHQFIKSPTLLQRYVQKPSEPQRALPIGSRLLAQWGDHLFLDEKLLSLEGELRAAIPWRENLLIAHGDRLSLLDANGELIDQLDESSLPSLPILALSGGNHPTMKTEAGTYRLSEDLLDFESVDHTPLELPRFAQLSDKQRKSLFQTLAAQTPVSQQRFLLDLHNFSFLGAAGRWISTLSCLLIVALAISGLCLLRKKKGTQGRGRTSQHSPPPQE